MVGLGADTEVVLAVIFVVAAAAKLQHHDEWRIAIASYRVIPQGLVRPFAFTVPALEVIGAALLVAGLRPFDWLFSGALSTAFTAVLAVAYARGARGDCGCFGTLLPMSIGPLAIVRALVPGVLAVLIAFAVRIPSADDIGSRAAVVATCAVAAQLVATVYELVRGNAAGTRADSQNAQFSNQKGG